VTPSSRAGTGRKKKEKKDGFPCDIPAFDFCWEAEAEKGGKKKSSVFSLRLGRERGRKRKGSSPHAGEIGFPSRNNQRGRGGGGKKAVNSNAAQRRWKECGKPKGEEKESGCRVPYVRGRRMKKKKKKKRIRERFHRLLDLNIPVGEGGGKKKSISSQVSFAIS